jgi:hypothetical protein
MTKFKEGNPGKKKGTLNKNTRDVREAFKNLLELNVPNMTKWIEQIAEIDPNKAMTLLLNMAEYHIPKLARVDNLQLNPDDNEPLTKIQIVDSTES